MTPETIVQFSQHALYVAMLIGAPLLLTALVVGLVIGMFQAATQINEMTLSFIPKLIAFVLVDGWTLLLGTLAGSFVT